MNPFFNVGVDKPTIISESGTPNEKIFNNIIELIEISNKKSNYDLLKDLEHSEVPDTENKDPFDFDASIEEKNTEPDLNIEDDITKVEN